MKKDQFSHWVASMEQPFLQVFVEGQLSESLKQTSMWLDPFGAIVSIFKLHNIRISLDYY